MTAVNNYTEVEEKISALKINSESNTDLKIHPEATAPDSSQIDGKNEGNILPILRNGSTITLPPGYSFSMSQESDECYNMTYQYRGHCVIFNHKEFDHHLGLGERSGTDKDRDSVKSMFKLLGFEVVVHNDLSSKGIEKVLVNYAYNVDHSDCDCFVLVFMSHGESGFLFGKNEPFKSENLFNHFTADNCPSLASKPKMFFIQACRGDKLDAGSKIVTKDSRDQTDSGSYCMYTIPNHADFLTCWSTVPGHYSWRNTTNGSWFIQSLVRVLTKYSGAMDVLSMMTVVNRYMIINFESNCPSNQEMHGKKQTASTVSTLMRLVYLKPKP